MASHPAPAALATLTTVTAARAAATVRCDSTRIACKGNARRLEVQALRRILVESAPPRDAERTESTMTTSDELVLRLERLLPAPRRLVFRAHTDPELLAKWWGPKGFSAPRIELDLRVG